MSRGAMLILALAFHFSLVVSKGGGIWNRWTFDSVATHGRRGWDFYAVYQAGHNLLTGVDVYEMAPHRIQVVVPWYTPYRYLPFVATTVGTLANALSPQVALVLWVTITDLLLLACAYDSWRAVRKQSSPLAAAMIWLCYTPLFLETYLGQFTLVQATLIHFLLRRVERRGWDEKAAMIWFMSLLWKHMTGLLAPVMIRGRRWRILAWAVAVVMAASAPYFVCHPGALRQFLSNFQAGPPGPQLGNHGVRQLLYSTLSALFPNLPVGIHQGLQWAWIVVVLLVTLIWTWRAQEIESGLGISLWVVTFFLVYHDIWEHHYVLLLPVFSYLHRRASGRFFWVLYVLIAMWTPYVLIDPSGLAAYHAPMRWTPLQPRILDVLYHASKALPVVLLWGLLLGKLQPRGRRAEAAS